MNMQGGGGMPPGMQPMMHPGGGQPYPPQMQPGAQMQYGLPQPQQPQPMQMQAPSPYALPHITAEYHVERVKRLSPELKNALTVLIKAAAENVLAGASEDQSSSKGTEDLLRAFQEFYIVCDQLEIAFQTITASRKFNKDAARFALYPGGVIRPPAMSAPEAKTEYFQFSSMLHMQMSYASKIHDILLDAANNLRTRVPYEAKTADGEDATDVEDNAKVELTQPKMEDPDN